MKTPNEYQQYDISKGNNDQKWLKKNNIQKGKEMNYVREDKGEYVENQQHQKHPNRKNISSYSNKNQGDEYENKTTQGQKGNNQSPNYKKNQKYKKENENEYLTTQMDDNQIDKDEFQPYKKSMTQQNFNKEGGGFNAKGNKGKYGQHQNGTYGQGPNQIQNQSQNMNWDKSQMVMANTHQQNQYQVGGYYDKKSYNGANSFLNQTNSNANPYPNQFNPQGQNQGQYNFRSNYQNEPKQNLLNLQQQGKMSTALNNNFNIGNNQQISGEYLNKNQGIYQFSNTEGNIPSNISASINQEQEPSNDSEDNYMQQSNQFIYNKGYNIHDPMETNSFISGMSDSILPGSMNSNNISILSAAPIQPYPNLRNIHNMPNMNRGYQQEMFMQQPIMNQGHFYMNDPQMMKGLNRNIGVMNMPPQQMPFGMDSSNQMFPMQQIPYGMNQNNGGVMTKTKKKSSKKIAQSPQEGMSNTLKGGMKLHYNNNSGKYYKGSHSTQGVKNTMPNFNGTNLSFINMNNNNNSMIQSNAISSNQIFPMQMNNHSLINNQGNQKVIYKQNRNMNNNNSITNTNPYRNVTSDKTIGSGIVSTPSKTKANDYYNNSTNNNKSQHNQYYNNKFQQTNRKYHQKYEDGNAQAENLDHNISNQDPNESNPSLSNAKASFYVKLRLEKNKEAVIEIKQNEDPIAIATTLKQYKINENQLTLVYNKIMETLNIMNYVMNFRLNSFDEKQMTSIKKTMFPSAKQLTEYNIKKHRNFPIIQIGQLNESFAYETIVYNDCLSKIRPNYSDIIQYELFNNSQ